MEKYILFDQLRFLCSYFKDNVNSFSTFSHNFEIQLIKEERYFDERLYTASPFFDINYKKLEVL